MKHVFLCVSRPTCRSNKSKFRLRQDAARVNVNGLIELGDDFIELGDDFMISNQNSNGLIQLAGRWAHFNGGPVRKRFRSPPSPWGGQRRAQGALLANSYRGELLPLHLHSRQGPRPPSLRSDPSYTSLSPFSFLHLAVADCLFTELS